MQRYLLSFFLSFFLFFLSFFLPSILVSFSFSFLSSSFFLSFFLSWIFLFLIFSISYHDQNHIVIFLKLTCTDAIENFASVLGKGYRVQRRIFVSNFATYFFFLFYWYMWPSARWWGHTILRELLPASGFFFLKYEWCSWNCNLQFHGHHSYFRKRSPYAGSS